MIPLPDNYVEIGPPDYAYPVVPSDEEDLPMEAAALHVNGLMPVTVITSSHRQLTFKYTDSVFGGVLPVRTCRVLKTGTHAMVSALCYREQAQQLEAQHGS